jgi:hypothetical protein
MKPVDSRTRAAFFNRTMHTPDDPERAETRASLKALSKSMLPLHRALIEATKGEYIESTGNPVDKPAHLLQLLTEDPFFAWLKPMTHLIVRIDEMTSGELEPPEVTDVVLTARRMFEPTDDPFSTRYFDLIQRDLEVAIAHPPVREAMKQVRARGDGSVHHGDPAPENDKRRE